MHQPHRRKNDPPAPPPNIPADMLEMRRLIPLYFELLRSLEWTSIGTAVRDFDKRTAACAPKET